MSWLQRIWTQGGLLVCICICIFSCYLRLYCPFVFEFVRAADQVSSNAAAESRAAVHSSQTRARQVDSDDGDNNYDGVLL